MAGAPTHTDPDAALHVRTLPELLAIYLETRQHARSAEADRLEAISYQVQGMATLTGGGWGKGTTEYFRRIQDTIKALRGPEFPPDIPEAAAIYPPEVLLVMRGASALGLKAADDGGEPETIP